MGSILGQEDRLEEGMASLPWKVASLLLDGRGRPWASTLSLETIFQCSSQSGLWNVSQVILILE